MNKLGMLAFGAAIAYREDLGYLVRRHLDRLFSAVATRMSVLRRQVFSDAQPPILECGSIIHLPLDAL